MTLERTLSIIKPNAVVKNVIGNIISRFENAGLIIIGIKMLKLTRKQAEGFYVEHQRKAFFENLINFMISGPIIVKVLEGENAVYHSRKIIGSTNPDNALTGTLRADYADSLTENAIHGSDSIQSSQYEISYFFESEELFSRIYS